MCGPVRVTNNPAFGIQYACEFSCPNPGEECLIFVDGVSSEATSVNATQLDIDDQITCRCPDDPANIPAVSEWGVVVLALLIITSGSLLFRNRRMQTA